MVCVLTSCEICLERARTAAGVNHDVKECPEAGHAFLSDHDPADVPILFAVMGRFAGGGYHEPSAERARADESSPSSAPT